MDKLGFMFKNYMYYIENFKVFLVVYYVFVIYINMLYLEKYKLI